MRPTPLSDRRRRVERACDVARGSFGVRALTRFLYLVRHGEHQDAEYGLADGPLSARGVRQASLLADRLSGVPFDSVVHSPLARAAETARILKERMPAVELQPSSLLFDCVPSGMTADAPSAYASFFTSFTEFEIDAGRAQMGDAVAEYLSGANDEKHRLLVTHNFVIGWFVREVLQAPDWRWMTLNQAHCGLTVLARKQGRPWTVLSFNDVAHLPFELRTGMPDDFVLV
jgi:serine/threonine-protein phosphatase PGAM5